jgi:hypothetical protein
MRGLAPFVAGVTRRYEWGIVPPARSTIIEGCAIEETNAGIRSGALNSASVCWPPRSEPTNRAGSGVSLTLAPSMIASAGTRLTRPSAVNELVISAVAVLLWEQRRQTEPGGECLLFPEVHLNQAGIRRSCRGVKAQIHVRGHRYS